MRQRFTVAMMADRRRPGLARLGPQRDHPPLQPDARRGAPPDGATSPRRREQISAAVRDTDLLVAAPRRAQGQGRRLHRAVRARDRPGRRPQRGPLAEIDPPAAAAAGPHRRRARRTSTACSPTGARCSASCAPPRPASSASLAQVGPFSRAGPPALVRLGDDGRHRRCAIIAATSSRCRAGCGPSPRGRRPGRAGCSPTLLVNLRDRGVVEYLGRFVYYSAAATARFDSTSHILPAHADRRRSVRDAWRRSPSPGCNAFFRDTEPDDAPCEQRRGRRDGDAGAPARRRRGDRDADAPPRRPPARPGGTADADRRRRSSARSQDVVDAAPRSTRHRRRRPHRLPPRPMSSRTGNPAHSGTPLTNPVLVGTTIVVALLVAVFLSYNANKGLPFVTTFKLNAEVPDAAAARQELRGPHRRLPGRPGRRHRRGAGARATTPPVRACWR